MLRHGGLRHPQPALDRSHRLFGHDQEVEDRAAVRLRDDGEHGFHVSVYSTEHILVKAYTSPKKKPHREPRGEARSSRRSFLGRNELGEQYIDQCAAVSTGAT